MYSKFYGFSHKPFELTPDPGLVFLSETHQEALSVLLYGVYNRKGFLQISGNVGTGKSTLVQALIGKLENNVRICHIPNPHFTVEEFYYYISAKFGLEEFDGNRAKFVLNLAEFLKQCREKDEFALLIIDEAQVLSLKLLEEIRLLSNQEYTEFGVLSIFFVGQPELNQLLKHKKMEPLRNRIGVRFNLDPLTLDETLAYIQFRLRKAGRTVLLFTQKAVERIHKESGGIPRSINIFCDNALLTGFAEQRGIIDESIIIECIRELGQSDVESEVSESDEISVAIETVPISPERYVKEFNSDGQKGKPKGFLIKLAFVFILICAIFFTLKYTTQFWGKLPGTEPVRDWFEKIQVDKILFKKNRDTFIPQINITQLSSTDNSKLSDEGEVLPGSEEEKIVIEHEYKDLLKSSAEVEDEKSLNNSAQLAETDPVRQNTDQIDAVENRDQVGAGQLPVEIAGTAVTAEKTAEEQKAAAKKDNNPAKQSGAGLTTISPIKKYTKVEQSNSGKSPAGTNTINDAGPAVPGTEKINHPGNEVALKQESTQESGDIQLASITDKVEGANIRSGPSMEARIIRTVSPGFPLRIIEKQRLWTLVGDYKNRRGWVATRLITDNTSVVLMLDKGHLYKGPSYLDDIISNLDYGTRMKVVEARGGWLNISTRDGEQGWIHKDMVWPKMQYE